MNMRDNYCSMRVFPRFIIFSVVLCLSIISVGSFFNIALASGFIISISQIDTSDFPLINLYISVINSSGQPIIGLKEREFSVFENDIPVNLYEFTKQKERSYWDEIKIKLGLTISANESISTVLVIDRSGSMNRAGKLYQAKKAAINYIDQLKQKDIAAVIIYDDKVELLQDFTQDMNKLIHKIKTIDTRGDTAFNDAIYLAIKKLGPIIGRKSVIALTDGLENSSTYTEAQVIKLAVAEGVPIYTIGLGDRGYNLQKWEAIYEDLLQRISADTGGKYFYAPSGKELTDLYELILEQIRHEYRLSYISPDQNIYKAGKLNNNVKVLITHNGVYQTNRSYNPDWLFGRNVLDFQQMQNKPGNRHFLLLSNFLSSDNTTIFIVILPCLLFLIFLPSVLRKIYSFIIRGWFSFRFVKVWSPNLSITTDKCPIDGVKFKGKNILVTCPKCKTVHHKECWEYNDKVCASCLYSFKKGDIFMSLKMRAYYYSIFGAIGGLLGWIFIESFLREVSASKYITEIAWGAVIGTLIGATIGITEGFLSESIRKSLLGILIGGVLGLVGGTIGPPIGEWVFEISGGELISRILGWTIFGIVIGVTGGVIGPEKSSDRATKGLLGGAIGGFIGGWSFKYLSVAFGTPSISRAIAILILGACIGFSIAFVQFILKEAWLTVKSAKKLTGKEFLLDKDINYIGSDWKTCNVYLPGDNGISLQHASLKRDIYQFIIESMSEEGTFVNEQKIDRSVRLKDGDRIRVGNANLIFRISDRKRKKMDFFKNNDVVRI